MNLVYLTPFCISMSNDSFRRWKNKFEFDVEFIKMHQNQGGQNFHLVRKSFKKSKSLKEMSDLQFVILHEK